MSGTTIANAAMPTTGMRTRSISSVAYADDDRLSDAKTASAVGFPSRSCASCEVASGGPRSRFLMRYRRGSGGATESGIAVGAPRWVSGGATACSVRISVATLQD